MNRFLRLGVATLALAGGAATVSVSGGCGSKVPAPGPATVKGRVLLNGQPVAGGLVVFAPNPERGGRGKAAFAQTAPDGSFALMHEKASAIPAGWYRVSLAAPAGAIALPAKLARPDLSGIEREVQFGKEHVFEFAVEVTE